MRYRVFAASLLATFMAQAAFAEDEPAEMPKPTLEPQVFSGGGDHVWHRPPEVQWVIISACGGGGGGGTAAYVLNPVDNKQVLRVGKGGTAAQVSTVIAAVSADKYAIHLGAGGEPGDGESTRLSGDDLTLSFPAGAGDSNNGGVGQPSVLGEGGAAGVMAPDGNPGSGSKGNGSCAGGGAGYPVVSQQVKGGAGATGYMAIVPLPDMARFARVLSIIEELAKPPNPTSAIESDAQPESEKSQSTME